MKTVKKFSRFVGLGDDRFFRCLRSAKGRRKQFGKKRTVCEQLRRRFWGRMDERNRKAF